MGRTEHRCVNFFFSQLPFHILVIHPPDSFFIAEERRLHYSIAIVLQASGKPDIGRGMQKNFVSFRAKERKGRE